MPPEAPFDLKFTPPAKSPLAIVRLFPRFDQVSVTRVQAKSRNKLLNR